MRTYTLNTKSLKTALAMFDRITAKSSSVPILENIHFQNNVDGLTMMRTELDLAITTGPARTAADWIGVDYRVFKTAIRSQKGATLELTINADREAPTLTIDGFTLAAEFEPDADIPGTCAIEDETTLARFSLSPANLEAILPPILAAMPCSDTRYYLNGAKFDIKSGRLTVTSSDGRRLAQVKPDHETVTDGAGNLANAEGILPYKTAHALNAMRKAGESVTVTVLGASSRQCRFIFETANGYRVDSKAIDGVYPSFDRAINSAVENWIAINPALLLTALEKIKPFIPSTVNSEGKKTNCFPVTLDANRSAGTLTIKGVQVDAAQVLPVDAKNDTRHSYDLPYLIDAVKTLPKAPAGDVLAAVRLNGALMIEHGAVTTLVMPQCDKPGPTAGNPTT